MWNPWITRVEIAAELRGYAEHEAPDEFDVAAYLEHLRHREAARQEDESGRYGKARTVRVNGEELTIAEAAKRIGLSTSGLRARLDREGLSPEEAMRPERRNSTPPRQNYKRKFGRREVA